MLIDMPLDELRTYAGTNPRPADFDAYWDRALAELDATPPEIEARPAAFRAPHAECLDLSFTGVGGASEDTGGVLGNTLRGHIIRGLDDHEDRLLFRQIFLDTVRLARIVMDFDEIDPERVGATGGSQGGGLTLACAALEPRIRRAAPIFPFLSDYQRVWEMDLAKGAYEEIQMYFRRFDPTHAREEDIFTRLGYIDVHNLASRINADTLMFTGLMDQVCPPSTQFAAYNAITAPKDMVIYPDFTHENLPESQDRVFTHMLEL